MPAHRGPNESAQNENGVGDDYDNYGDDFDDDDDDDNEILMIMTS